MPLAAVEPALFLELRGVLREVGAVGVLLGLPPVGGVLQHAVLLLLVAHRTAGLDEVVVVEVQPLVVFGVAVVEWHAHGLVQAHDEGRVEDHVSNGLDAALARAEDAAGALGHAAGVGLQPVGAGEDVVGGAVVRAGPQVDVHPEVELREGVPRLEQVGLVHEVTGHADAAVELVGGIDLADGVPDGGGVGPGVPEAQKREALGRDLVRVVLERSLQAREGTRSLVVAALAHSDDAGLLIGGDVVAVALHERRVLVLQVLHEVLDERNLVFHGKVARRVAELHGADALADAPVDGVVIGHDHVGAAAAAVHLGLRGAAVAGGLVGVAGEAGDELQGAGVLHGVSGLVGGQLVVDAAVAVKRVQARGVGAHGLFDLVGGNLGDLGDTVERVLLQVVLPLLPDRLGLDHLAIGELDLHAVGPQLRILRQALRVRLGALLVALAGPVGVVGRVGRVGELRGVGQPRIGDDGLVGVLDPGTGGRDLVLLALPLAFLGVPVGRLLVGGVPADEAAVGVLLRRRLPELGDPLAVEVGFGEQAARHVDAAVHLQEVALVGLAVGLRVVEERAVGPALHEVLVVGVVVDDPLQPAERHGQVGADADGKPQVGLLAQRAHARVNQNVLVGALRAVHDGTVGGVVIGVLGRGAPLHVHDGALLDLHPRRALLIGEHAAEVARPLADLVGGMEVVGPEDGLQGAVGRLRPHARGTAHGEDRLSAVLVDELVVLGADLVHGLGEVHAHPAGIVLALGVGALHGVAQTIGVVQRQHGRLGLRAAVAAAVCVGLVTFYLDDLVVLHGDPHTAFAFAARAAAGTDALDLTS